MYTMELQFHRRFLTYLITLVLLLSFVSLSAARAQDRPGQVVRGQVTDYDLKIPLPGANVSVPGTDPLIGTMTDASGRFVLENVPLGRQSIHISFIGYEPVTVSEVLVSSGKEVVLQIELQEQVIQGEEVVVTAAVEKDRPINDMAYVSARSFSVEETRRYAGGVDDPARMASAFAGVTSTGGVQQNALVIRGNAPKGVLWRLEGVEIPNPNHFAGLSIAGGGGLTLFSSQLLANSDFLTGAFPAEYGNALSGVFDMNFRSGNPARREYTVQIGLNGIEGAVEGPFANGGASTYLLNYRYSTLGLLMPLLPTDALATYQDLSFKLNFPTKKAGRVVVWGLGGLDGQHMKENTDSTSWESEFWDRTKFDMRLGIGAAGISNTLILGGRSYLKTTAALTVNHTRWNQERLDDQVVLQPDLYLDNTSGQFIISTYLNQKSGARHINRTGFIVQQQFYQLDISAAPNNIPPVVPVVSGSGSSTLLQLYSQSRLNLSPALTLNLGGHAQYFALSEKYTLEPRVGLRWQFTGNQAVSFGYGLHSQLEDLRFYLIQLPGTNGYNTPNKNLDFTKAHHGVVGFDRRLSDVARLKLEAYYQYLFDVPVVPDSSYSLLNFEQDWTFGERLINDGLGENYGLELTVERFLKDGYYYLFTGSLFRSRYRGGDGVWRNTRYDQRFAANALFGKEFEIGRRNHLLGINGRLILVGGKRRSPVDLLASRLSEEVVFDDRQAFSVREPGQFIFDLTLTYRLNRTRFSEVWALQVKNVLAAKDISLDYNYQTRSVEVIKEGYPLPVLSYKIEF